MSTSTITLNQLRNREIVVADLLKTGGAGPARTPAAAGLHDTIITAAATPLSVFGRKLAGHES